jgi:ATP-dependent DNA helicase RecG
MWEVKCEVANVTTDDLAEMLARLRRVSAEPESVEVKSGRDGFPRSVRESMVALANGDGGTIIIGIDESGGFSVVDLPDAAKYRDMLAQMARDELTPALRLGTDIVEIEGGRIVVATVPPVPQDQKPAFVTSQGVSTGSYIRVGDGDRRMSEAEIALTYASRTQPVYDREPVAGTSVSDLQRSAVVRMLERVRIGSPSLRDADESLALHRLGVLAAPDSAAPLTLAGLLTFGDYPQQWFPQLMASVAVHPAAGDEARFLDNVTVRGSVPQIIAEVLSVVRRNLAARAEVTGEGRRERLDYPLEAIREAVVNALLHRDYSPVTRGTQVQVDLFPDRLEIRSPGGLYGGLVTDDLGEEGVSSSRNAVLASLLSDSYLPGTEGLVAENRASGVPAMLRLARAHGLPRPVFRSRITSFLVTMSRSALLGPDVRTWMASLRADLPTPAHEVALAMMRSGEVTNAALREWGVDRIEAGQVLRDLVGQGLAVKEGGRRYARYLLDPAVIPRLPADRADLGSANTTRQIIQALGLATAAEIAERAGLGRQAVLNHLKRLMETGEVIAEGSPRSPRRRYRWSGDVDEPE